MGEQHSGIGYAGKRRPARQALIQQATERVDIGPAVHLLAADLLRSHIVDRAQRASLGGQPVSISEPAGEAEVGQIHVLVRVEQHVRGLDVSVHQPAFMRGVERVRDLRADRDRPLGTGRVLAQELPEISPFDVAHGDEQLPRHLARVIDRNDVRVIDRGSEARLGQEALAKTDLSGELRREDLERDRAIQRQVVRPIHNPHAATTKQRLDPIAGELAANSRVGRYRHARPTSSRSSRTSPTAAHCRLHGAYVKLGSGPWESKTPQDLIDVSDDTDRAKGDSASSISQIPAEVGSANRLIDFVQPDLANESRQAARLARVGLETLLTVAQVAMPPPQERLDPIPEELATDRKIGDGHAPSTLDDIPSTCQRLERTGSNPPLTPH